MIVYDVKIMLDKRLPPLENLSIDNQTISVPIQSLSPIITTGENYSPEIETQPGPDNFILIKRENQV